MTHNGPSTTSTATLEEELAGALTRVAEVSQMAAEALEARDAAIVALCASGVSLRRVGALAGLSHQGVADVVRRRG
jgi:hypothetical protein